MTLRQPNNPCTPDAILQVLRFLLPVGTRLGLYAPDGTGVGQMFTNSLFLFSQSTFPAVHLSYKPQQYKQESGSTFGGRFDACICYFDRWDSQSATLDSIWAAISADLLRMQSTLESNDRLVYQGQQYLAGIERFRLSAYTGEIDHQVPGMALPYRKLTATCLLQPFDA